MPKKFKPYQQNLKRLWKLKPRNKLLKDFFVLDVETGIRKRDGNVWWCLDARPQRMIFCVIYGYNYSKVFFSVDEVKKELLTEKFKNKIVFAHNGGGYDFPCIYGNIYDTDPEAIFNGKFISFTNGNCTFADSMNVFVGLSVKKIGQMMKLEKGILGDPDMKTKNGFLRKGVYDLDKFGAPVLVELIKEVIEDIKYCCRDCVIIWEALFSVFEFAGAIKITQASLSMNYYRTFHQPFHIDHNENTKFFWLSYYGGRCEAFKIGKTHSKVIDVNSMYPDMMKNLKFPNPKILKYEKDLSVKLFKKYLGWYEGCAEAVVLHHPTTFGYLPFKQNGKLLFPVGKISGFWNFNELRFALEKGAIEILKVKTCIYSEPMESPFISYVDVLNEMKVTAKATGNLAEEDRAKRFSNSLYGKFAQRISEESIYIDDITKKFDIIQEHQKNNTFIRLVTFNKKRNDAFLIIKSGKNFNVSYAIPSFASYITSGARVKLLDKMLSMQKNNIVYCDTDSIFFENDFGDIISEFHLGGWKVENKIITNIKGLKNYHYIEEKTGKEIWRVKGVPVNKGNTTKIFDESGEFVEVPTVEQIGENKFRYYNLTKTKEALKRNLDPGVLTERIKELKNTYDKRIILFDGSTKPIEIK